MQDLRCLGELPVLILIIFHLAFWWKFYANPWRLCTSEIVSNEYPHWLWMGRQLRKGIWPMKDNIYYREPGSIPFLCTFYPPYFITAYISSFCNKITSFQLYSRMIYIHSLLGSMFSYIVMYEYLRFGQLVSLFGALSLTYNAYMIRPQTACMMFTMAWIPACLISGWFGQLAFGMAILGGYWPIILIGFPIFFFNLSCLVGVVFALPQVIPFLRYYPKSIRAKRKVNPQWGRMPIKRFFLSLRWPENGMIHYPEYSFGIGVCSFVALFIISPWWIVALYALIGSQGVFILDRIPARFVYLLSFSLVMASIPALEFVIRHEFVPPLMILQGFLLWKNRDIYPSFPFSQWWRKIDEHKFEGKEWPNNTGYMNEEHHHDYYGGFALAENYRD